MNFLQGRPLRLGGVALIGVAAIAAVIGIVTAVTGGGGENGGGTAAPPAPSASSAPGGSGAPTTSAPPSGSSSAPAPPPSSEAAPPPGTNQNGAPPNGNAGGVPADQSTAKWVPVRVYNNSTITGLAARASDDMRNAGWNVVETAPYPYGIIPTTTAFYTPGTDEETAAKALAAAFGMKAEPRFEGIKNASPGVIVILTKDYQGAQTKGS